MITPVLNANANQPGGVIARSGWGLGAAREVGIRRITEGRICMDEANVNFGGEAVVGNGDRHRVRDCVEGISIDFAFGTTCIDFVSLQVGSECPNVLTVGVCDGVHVL